MTPETAINFLKALGVKDPFVKQSTTGVWVTGACPLAPFLHKSGKDTNPSFGVNATTGNFNCYTCKTGSLVTLLHTIEFHLPKYPTYAPRYQTQLARQILKDAGNELEPLPAFDAIKPAGKPFVPWPEDWPEKFAFWRQVPRAAIYIETGRVETNESQPVDAKIADAMGLRYDAAYDRIVCPYRHFNGKLAGARGRAIDPSAHMQHYDYTWNEVNNSSLVWYNEPALEAAALAKAPVIVVEGQFDAMNVLRVYPYVVANLTSKASIEKMVKLQSTYGILLMLDNDDAGKEGLLRYKEHLLGKVDLGVVSYPQEFKDPAKLTLVVLQETLADLI